MQRQLAIKELRETWWIPLAGLVAFLFALADLTGFGFDTRTLSFYFDPRERIPFGRGEFAFQYMLMIGGGVAVALGLWQSVGESFRGTWPFLLHRAVRRERLMATKLLVGLGLCGAGTLIPLLAYALWAATPGTHASPFDWSLTKDAWVVWLTLPAVYLGAFLSGLRPARWYGTRLFPLAAGIGVALLPPVAFDWSFQRAFGIGPAGMLPVVVLVDVVLVAAILYTARTRDYS